MVHVAGDPGWVAWTNTVDAQVAAAQVDILARLTAVLAASTYVPLTDARMTDARTPTAHTQAASTITDFATAVNALIPAGSITAWTAYTPTLSAGTGTWSLGTTGAVNACVWRYEGALVRVRYKFVLGTGFTFPTADPRFTLPVAAEALAHGFMVFAGQGSIHDTTVTGRNDLTNVLAVSTTVVMVSAGANPTGSTAITPTSPFTWAAGHVLAGEFTYRPA